MSEPIYDVFISHASDDKVEVVRPLVVALERLGTRVWLDEIELTLGESLREGIDRGLIKSQFGIVILSPAFFRKKWTREELDGLLALEDGTRKVILPVWHNVTQKEVVEFSATLAGRFAVSTTVGVDVIALKICEALNRHRAKQSSDNSTALHSSKTQLSLRTRRMGKRTMSTALIALPLAIGAYWLWQQRLQTQSRQASNNVGPSLQSTAIHQKNEAAAYSAKFVDPQSLQMRLGGLAYFDVHLGSTFLTDANLPAKKMLGVTGIAADGSMTWGTAQAWIRALNKCRYLDYDDWRLPDVFPLNESDVRGPNPENTHSQYDGTIDLGYNVGAPGTEFYQKSKSELPHLYYNELGNAGFQGVDGKIQHAREFRNAPFVELKKGNYWTGREWYGGAIAFDFDHGSQYSFAKNFLFRVLVARSGDSPEVPFDGTKENGCVSRESQDTGHPGRTRGGGEG